MAFACPGCREPIDVDASHGWPYIRSAVLMHLDVCTALQCGAEERERCADVIADVIAPTKGVASHEAFRCPFDICKIKE